MKKTIPLLTLLLAFSVCLQAQSVTKTEADLAASRFAEEKFLNAGKSAAPEVIFQEILYDNDIPCLFRYSVGEKGFILICGSKAVTPVAAYSTDDNFGMVPPVRDLLEQYKAVIARSLQDKSEPTPEVSRQWNHLLAATFVPSAQKSGSDGYLLTTRWNQNKYYNTYCPWDVSSGSYYDYRVPNGCVALACAQIMNYHHWPVKPAVTIISYVPTGYPRQTVYYNRETYHWEAMCNEPQSYANEIAKIAHQMGVAIQMNYTPDGSGAQTDDAKNKLYQVFKYDQSIATYYRAAYTDSASLQTYVKVLKDELDRKRPIYYSGCTAQGSCHAYILDGYDNDDKFHINFGWGGSGNGYYAIDNFGFDNFSSEAIVNIFPSGIYPEETCSGHQRLTASFGYIYDSNPATPYASGPDCSWTVAVPHATAYTFSFDKLDLDPDVDFVTIYNGATAESGVKATFTGNTLPSNSITVQADSVLVTFTAAADAVPSGNDHYGFQISYESTLEHNNLCPNQTNVSEWNTILTDGSGDDENYYPETNCTWNVQLQYISGYSFAFRKFDLGYGDFVDIYDATTYPPELYKRFDLNNLPGYENYNVNFRKMLVNFVSDNWSQSDGFEMEYWAIASVDQESGIEDLKVYPNPTSGNLFVEFSLTEAESVTCQLTDAAGKSICTEQIEGAPGLNKHALLLPATASGFYLLQLTTQSGKTIRKVMVQ